MESARTLLSLANPPHSESPSVRAGGDFALYLDLFERAGVCQSADPRLLDHEHDTT